LQKGGVGVTLPYYLDTFNKSAKIDRFRNLLYLRYL
jgi:hypothetical protein